MSIDAMEPTGERHTDAELWELAEKVLDIYKRGAIPWDELMVMLFGAENLAQIKAGRN